MRSSKNIFSNTEARGLNLTGLVDIVFLLIIFFMLVGRYITAETHEVNLASAVDETISDIDKSNPPVTLTVKTDSQGRVVYILGKSITATEFDDDISDRLADAMKGYARQGSFIISIDRDISYQHTANVLEALQTANIESVQLAVSGEE